MNTRIALFLLVTLNLIFAGEKTIPTYVDPPEGMYFKDWLLCGPFPNPLPEGVKFHYHDETSLGFYRDYLTAAGSESQIQPFAGLKTKHPNGRQVAWKSYHGYMPLIPLDEIFTPKDEVIAYAACVIESATERRVVLSVTSNDGVRVWLNTDLVLDHNTGGTEEPDRDLVAITLKPGQNRILVKVAQGFGKWSFQLRLLEREATVAQLLSRAYLFSRPEITETPEGWKVFVGQRCRVELTAGKIPAQVHLLEPDGKHIIQSFNTFLGAEIDLSRAELNLQPGLYPVHCQVVKPDGALHTLRSSIFVGTPPNINATYSRFQSVPRLDSTTNYGGHVNSLYHCLNFHLNDDVLQGRLQPMDAWSQRQIVNRYANYVHHLSHAPSPYHLIFPELQHIQPEPGMFLLAEHLDYVDLTNGACAADLERLVSTVKTDLRLQLRPGEKNASLQMGLLADFPEMQKTESLPNAEAYLIKVNPSGIKVIGASVKGLHFGLVTLRQLFQLSPDLPAATILDYPVSSNRCTFSYWPLPMDDAAKKRLFEFIDLKYNEIVIATGAYLQLEAPQMKEQLAVYFKLCRDFHVDPIPTVWLTGDKSWYEGIWLQDEPVQFKKDKCVFDFQHLVNLENSRPVLHSEKGGGQVFVAGQDYQIISFEPPIIKRLPSGRIPKDALVYMDADIVDDRAHRFFKPCPSEEAVYQAFSENIKNTIDILKPGKIHVNHDELGIMNSDSRCIKRHLGDADLAAEQINRMRNIIKQYAPQVDMIMWADAVNPYHNAYKKVLENTCTLMKKDIILANWFYTAEDFSQIDLCELGTGFFLDLGFRTYGCPWDNLPNHQTWENTLERHRENPLSLGLMHTEWGGRNSGAAQTAAINWCGRTWLTR